MDATNIRSEEKDNGASIKSEMKEKGARKRKSKPKTVIVKYETVGDNNSQDYEVIIEGPETLLTEEDASVWSYDQEDSVDNTDTIPRRRRRFSAHKGESSEERDLRLARMSAYSAQRLANESPEARALRLKRMSEYAARRLSKESPEARAIRLQRMSAYAAHRIARESPEARAARLARMSAYAAKRHALKKAKEKAESLDDQSYILPN